MSSLTLAETDLIVEGLEDESGLILGLENDSLAVTLNDASGLDVWGSNIFKESSSTELNFLKTLEALPDEKMHRFLTKLLDYAEWKSKRGILALDDNSIKDIRKICDRFKDIKPAPQTFPLSPNPSQPAPRPNWKNDKVNAYVNRSFEELMCKDDFDYELPRFQRAYSWQREQFRALWEDLLEIRRRHEPHFMGFIFLRPVPQNPTEVLDGQQRFVTMSLLVLAALNRLNQFIAADKEAEKNMNLHQMLRNIVVPRRQHKQDIRPRLRLGQDRTQYDNMVYHQDGRKEEARVGNARLYQAFSYFESKFASFTSGNEVYEFITDMKKGTYFTEFVVRDTYMAYKLFDTINNRGMLLSYIDIVKNHLFNLVEPYNEMFIDDSLRHWDEMVVKLGQLPFRDFVHAVLSRYEEGNGTRNLLEKIQALLDGPMSTVQIVQELSDNAAAYTALTGTDRTHWDQGTKAGRWIIRSIEDLEALGVTSHLGVALTALQTMPLMDFANFMRKLVVMAVRHLVVYGNANGNLAKRYADLSAYIYRESPGMSRLRSELIKICPRNSLFRSRFEYFKVVGDTKLAKYLMSELEHEASRGTWPDPQLTLEHVLPQKSTYTWSEIFGRYAHSINVDRIGNFALLPGAVNSEIGQADFETKRQVLAKSELTLNRRIAKSETWDYDALHAHQVYLAKLAVKAWKL